MRRRAHGERLMTPACAHKPHTPHTVIIRPRPRARSARAHHHRTNAQRLGSTAGEAGAVATRLPCGICAFLPLGAIRWTGTHAGLKSAASALEGTLWMDRGSSHDRTQ